MADSDDGFIILLDDNDADGVNSSPDSVGGEDKLKANNGDEFVVLLDDAEDVSKASGIPVEEGLSIEGVRAFHQKMCAIAAEHPGDLALDVSAVDQLDSAGLQLLVAFQRSLALANRKVTYCGLSASAEAAIQRAGFTTILALE